MLSIKEAKAQARVLKTFLTEHEVTLPHGICLEAIARLMQQKNWATYLVQANAAQALFGDLELVRNWPVFVFYFDEDEDTQEEKLCVLPAGALLSERGRTSYYGVDCKDGRPVPEGFKLGAKTVVRDVHAQVPAIDKYGLPWFGDEEAAAEGFRAELHCAALDFVEVSLRDTGDDSGSRFWFEAYVAPDLAEFLAESVSQDSRASSCSSPH